MNKCLNRDYKDYGITKIFNSAIKKNNQVIMEINLNQGSRL